MSYRTRGVRIASGLIACLMAMVSLAGLSYAQLSSGSILGTITDGTGAVIPGVTIKISNPDIGLSREVLSNESGNYRVDQLPIGAYNIEVELTGFKKEVRSGVRINIDQRARLDFTLQPGNVSEVVEVRADAPIVQSEDSSIGQVVEERKIVALPLNGRDFSQLAYMVPGAFTPRPGSSLGDRGGFSVAGLNESTNQFLLDGVNNNGTGTMEIAARINVDAVGEFKVQTGTYSAQYGRYAGAQVDVVTKSGTNNFHGSAFAFTRNDNLDARNFFDRAKPEFRRHQYGGTIGGPIIRDRLFFFAGFQGQRQYQFQSTAPSVPTPAMFNGDLSGQAVARDPATNQPFPNNQIPSSMISPITRAMAQFWPQPTRSGIVQNTNSLLPTPDKFYQPNGKIDWQVNSQHRFSGSYNFYNNELLEWAIAGRPEVPGFMTDSLIKSQGLSLSEVWMISPSTINEFRAGFGRVRRVRQQEDRTKNWNATLGIPGTTADVDPIAWGVPFVAITGFARIGDNTNMPQPRIDQTFSFADNVSLIRGNHAFKVGGDFFMQTMNLVLISNGRGVFRFTGQRTGNAFADFLLGLPAQTERQPPLGPLSAHPRRNSFNAFFQDDWKVRPNLTLNMGVRYEATGRMTEKYGKLARFEPTLNGGRGGMIVLGDHERFNAAVATYRTLYPTLTIERGAEQLFQNDYNNIAPRFGFAWSPKLDTVVRGAYGIFYQIDDLCLCDFYQNPPFNRSEIYNFTTTPGLSMTNPWGTSAAGPINMSGIDPELASPYYQQASLGLQHQLPGDIVMDVSWQMKKGTKIDRARDLNQPLTPGGARPYANFGRITYIEDSANTIYHGMHSRFEKRTSRNESFLVSYVWGKMIDDATTSPQDSYNLRAERALSTDDVRHRFNASYVLPLPFGAGRRFASDLQGVGRQILSGWELSGILRASSGNPLSAQLTRVSAASGNTWDRPNLVGDPNSGDPTPAAWWNQSAFAIPANGTFGNAGRNLLIGPGNVTFDFNVLKNIDIAEGQHVQLRFEFFNLLNKANFQTSGNQNPEASNFGAISTAYPARQIQLGLKYFF